MNLDREVGSDILLLYELALAVGQSLEPEEASRRFISVLMARKDLAFASLWVECERLRIASWPGVPQGPSGGYRLVYAVPKIRAATDFIAPDHSSLYFPPGEASRAVPAGHDDFDGVIAEHDVQGGGYALFQLKNLGVLKLYTRRQGGISLRELRQLRGVVDNFAVTLRGALAHRQLKLEVAERKTAQQSLERQRALLRSLIDSVPDLIFYKDHQSVYLGCNQAFQRYANRAEEEIIGHTDFDLFDPKTAEFFRDKDAQMLATGQARSNEEWIRYPDGRRKLMDTLKTPYFGPDGDVLGLIGVSRDITDRNRIEEQLRQRLEFERAIALVSSRFVGVTDIDEVVQQSLADFGRLSHASRAYLFLFSQDGETMDNTHEWCDAGVSSEQANLQGLPLAAVPWWVSTLRRGETIFIRNVAQMPAEARAERELLEAQGIRSLLSLPVTIDGSLAGFIGFDYLAGIREWSEEDINLLRVVAEIVGNALEREQAEVQRSRLQRELAHAHKMEALGQLTGGIAHDFNNILAVILGFVALAEVAPGVQRDERLQEYLTTIGDAGRRAQDLVAQMLAFSRKDPVETKRLTLLPMVKEVVRLCRSTLPSSIEITETLNSVPDVLLNPVEVQQVLMNLFVNARDAMDGKGVIRVRLTTAEIHGVECAACHRTVSGAWVELTVEDCGPGISPEVQAHMFEPFFTTKPVGEGTGMGLAMLLSIVERANGHVLVESSPEGGARFRLLLPMLEGPAVGTPTQRAVEWHLYADLRGRVLVVDDEPQITILIREALRSTGLEILTFNSSRDAFEAIAADPHRFDLVVTDQTMPGMTGVELVQAVRQLRPDLPIILMTGYSVAIDEAQAQILGIDRFLTKPLEVGALVETVCALVNDGSSGST